MFSYRDSEKIDVGVMIYLYYPGGMNQRGRYEGPIAISKTTKTQFTAGGQRFMKSNGRPVGNPYGRFSASVSLATPEMDKEVKEFRAETKRLKKKAEKKANKAEMESRKKYGALEIIDDDIQKKYLKPLRFLADCGEKEMSDLLDAFEGVSVENENFWRIEDAIERENRHNSFAYGKVIRDRAMALHQQLIDLALEFETGTRYEVGGVEVESVDELMEKKIRRVLHDQMRTFFGYTFSNRDITTADQRFMTVLREILKDDDHDKPLKKIEEEDDA